MQGADNQHFPVLPGDVDDAVQARYKRLIQDAGFQCQVIIGGQQQKESRMQRQLYSGPSGKMACRSSHILTSATMARTV